MLEQSLEVVEKALNAANKSGVFNLQDSALVAQAFTNVKTAFENWSKNTENVSKDVEKVVTKKESK